MNKQNTTVLIVEDEPNLADLYATWLTTEYTIEVAYGAEEALEKAGDSIDVMLLDRRMPKLSGNQVSERVREAGHQIRVAMVTAVEPDFDILELSFDDYIVKPVSREDLLDTVSELSARDPRDEEGNTLYELSRKKALLEDQKSSHELQTHETYQKFLKDLESLQDRLN
jgi:DNA-binding response OmpR family regulator